MYRAGGKRFLDVVISISVLLVLSPVLLLLAVAVRLILGSPILFRQQRPGKLGRPFTLLKFRTMAPPNGVVESDEARLTPFGRLMRQLSVDELPELINVLRGDMSLVGPRPLLMQYLDRYTPHQARRHDVRPGITGWAQVNGRNALGWEARFDHDVWYVDHVTFETDMRILVLTVWKVLTREGISEPGQATAREFMGSGQP
jgi:sugar transferase EpsL